MKLFLKISFVILLTTSQVILAQMERALSFGWSEEKIEVAGSKRYFSVFIPRECPSEASMVLVLHSANSGMETLFSKGDGFNEWPNLAEREKFILIAPNGVNPITGNTGGSNQKWNDCRIDNSPEKNFSNFDDVLFIERLLDWSIDKLDIDSSKIYTAGIGNGGMMVYRLAVELGNRLAGAAVFFANLPLNSECGPPVKPIPIFIMNSKDDPLVPYDGGMIIGEQGLVMSSEETLNYWVSLNLLNTQKRTNKFYSDTYPDDNSRIIKNEFNRPLENPHVVFNVITNSGHIVPSIKYELNDSQLLKLLGNQNRDLEGVVEAWHFLKNYSLR